LERLWTYLLRKSCNTHAHTHTHIYVYMLYRVSCMYSVSKNHRLYAIYLIENFSSCSFPS
jgi:hypothetical protein